jgi:Flp pilus assembly protein TadG
MQNSKTRNCNNRRIWDAILENRAQALVELALTVPMLVALLIGAAELARVSYVAIEVANAAKAAAQYGAQNATTAADITGMKTAAANDAGNLTGLTTTASVASGVITVETSATFNPLIHLPGLPTTFTLHGQAIQQVL